MNEIHWLLIDLDETLYSPETGVWQAIALRISEFMTQKLHLPPSEIQNLREQYFNTYGTTLNGLIAHHDVNPEEYMDFVHDIPIERYLSPNIPLQDMLTQLPQRKAIFTNADRQHVLKVTRTLGIEKCFHRVIDQYALDWINKPQPLAYKKALQQLSGADAKRCMIVDDQPRNLLPAKELGMFTVLVGKEVKGPGIDFCIPSILDLVSAIPELTNNTSGEHDDT
jgi:pyrimidine 5'-nucleotidase